MRLLPILLVILLLSLLAQSVAASAGINPPPLEQRSIVFQPGLTRTWSFYVFGAPMIETYLSGDLQQYATLDDPAQNTSARSVSLTLHLPDDLEPGRYVLRVFSQEASPGGMIGARAAVGAGVVVLRLYPTPYLEAALAAKPTGVGESTTATLSLTSWSEVVTPDAWAELVVKDQTGKERARAVSEHVSIPAQGTKKLTVPLRTEALEQGRYDVEAVVHGAQPNLTARASFKVGVLDLALRSYPKELSADTINRFAFTIENEWNQELHDAYGVVDLGGVSEKTPTGSLPAFGTSQFTAYLDTSSLDSNATLQGDVTMHYMTPEGERGEKELPFTVSIVSKKIPGTALSQEPRPAHTFSIPINTMTLLYAALLLLVVLNLFLLFRRRGDGKPPRIGGE